MRLSVLHVATSLAAVGLGLMASFAQTPASAPATSPAALGRSGQDAPPPVPLVTGVHPVKLTKDGGKWQLTRDGKPYFIKGVGGDYSRDILLANGGNSVRIWGIDKKTTAPELNDDAKKDITVALGYWVGHKDKGFRWDDPEVVKAQLEEFKRVVTIYKDCPAVLVWAIGNEMENGNDTPVVWQAIEDMAKAAHEIDPNHPTMTVIAEVGGTKVANLHKNCPDIDIVGINSYAGGGNVGDRYLKQAGKDAKPYVITEFGPPGQWEFNWPGTHSKFGSLIELTSTVKANTWYKNTYDKTVAGHPNECLGSYAFLWGNKAEATSTWYGMFLPDGSKLAAADIMLEAWTGKKTDAPCPVMKKMSIVGSDDVKAGETVKAKMDVTDPMGGALKYEWVLQREMPTQEEPDPNAPPTPTYPEAIAKNGEAEVTLTMPKYNGVYRVYGFARNEKNGAALCSLPVKVTGGEEVVMPASKPKP
jgi:hypothetical protein